VRFNMEDEVQAAYDLKRHDEAKDILPATCFDISECIKILHENGELNSEIIPTQLEKVIQRIVWLIKFTLLDA
jgi:hypothetical protein